MVPSTILGEEPVDQLEEDNEANDNASIVEDGGVFFVAWVEVLGEDKANVGGREENDWNPPTDDGVTTEIVGTLFECFSFVRDSQQDGKSICELVTNCRDAGNSGEGSAIDEE